MIYLCEIGLFQLRMGFKYQPHTVLQRWATSWKTENYGLPKIIFYTSQL